MKAKKTVDKVQEKTAILPEVLADEIVKIAQAMHSLMAGRLKRSTVVLLVSKASGVNLNDTQLILNAIESLDNHYLK